MKKSYYLKAASMGVLLVILFAFQKYTSKEREDFTDFNRIKFPQ